MIYRTGGWALAQWHVTSATRAGAETEARVAELERMGFKAMAKSPREIEAIGLPVGWCSHADPITGEMREKRCSCT